MSVQVIAGAAMVSVAVPVAWWAVAGQGRVVGLDRLERGHVSQRDVFLMAPARTRVIEPAIRSLAERVRRLTPASNIERIEHRIAAAGKQGIWTVEQVLAVKMVAAVVGLLLTGAMFAASPSILNLAMAIATTAVGWVAPDVVLDGRGKDRAKVIQRELPDVIDQITVAVEAGLGFEAAVARVCASGTSVLKTELARTLQDIQLGMARTVALTAMAERCEVADLRQFVSSARQAEKYGLPIANVLRVQAAELRDKRRQRAEEQAMKLPVKVVFPLVFCILPAMFIVIIGPGAIRMADTFLKM